MLMSITDLKYITWKAAVVLLGCLVFVSSNVVKRSTDNPCYQCSRWDAVGQGFVETGDDCTAYYECWKVFGTGLVGPPLRRFCPIGSMVHPNNAVRGAPCGHCDASCPACMRDYTTIPIILDCHYIQMNPPEVYGMDDGAGGLTRLGSCGVGGYFNDSYGVCTCTEVGPGCTLRVNMPLENDILDHSCHKAWVAQSGMPALVTFTPVSPPPGLAGSAVFTGFNPALGGSPHLTTYGLDGAFAGNWVFAIVYSAWFNIDIGSSSTGIFPVVTLGNCAQGPAAYIWVVDGRVVAGIELLDTGITMHDLDGPLVNMGEWYHVYLVYDGRAASDNIQLYVLDVADNAACNVDLGTCTPYATKDATGSLSPRGCGFSIGDTGLENRRRKRSTSDGTCTGKGAGVTVALPGI